MNEESDVVRKIWGLVSSKEGRLGALFITCLFYALYCGLSDEAGWNQSELNDSLRLELLIGGRNSRNSSAIWYANELASIAE
jgi:hypothetical protein